MRIILKVSSNNEYCSGGCEFALVDLTPEPTGLAPGLQQRLVKMGGRLIKHARYYWLLLAESHLTRRLFWKHAAQDRGAAITSRIDER
jgi:hypothetical protein